MLKRFGFLANEDDLVMAYARERDGARRQRLADT
jgi:hypothetical protein